MAEKRRVIDGTLLWMLGLLAGLALLAQLRGGGELLRSSLGEGAGMLLRFAPVIVVSLLAAGFADQLISRDWVREWLGGDAGLQGIVIGAAAGAITPSGPFVSMPIAAVMLRAGAGPGPVVAFVAAWSLLAIHRFVAWEVPFLGWRFALLRYGVCLVLPVAAGLAARSLARSGVG